jgi:uncharacterized membrane protein
VHSRRFFNVDEEARIVQAIKNAETLTSGEIRLHVNDNYVGNFDAYTQQLFLKLNMTQTKNRNAILFYIAIEAKRFAVLGDTGIHAKVDDAFWLAIAQTMETEFKKQNYCEALVAAITQCGTLLQKHFPYTSHDTNELSNDISYE